MLSKKDIRCHGALSCLSLRNTVSIDRCSEQALGTPQFQDDESCASPTNLKSCSHRTLTFVYLLDDEDFRHVTRTPRFEAMINLKIDLFGKSCCISSPTLE
jgi:hypothetical protein